MAGLNNEESTQGVIINERQNTRMRLSLSLTDTQGVTRRAHNTYSPQLSQQLEDTLKDAQREIVEQEIFSLLVREAGNLPTVSARVSERLIIIDAAQGTELRIELVRRSFNY